MSLNYNVSITVSSNTTVQNSNLNVTGNLTLGSSLTLQNAKITVASGNLFMAPASNLDFSDPSSLGSAPINVAGAVVLSGTLTLDLGSLVQNTTGPILIPLISFTGNISGSFDAIVVNNQQASGSDSRCGGTSYSAKPQYSANSFGVILTPVTKTCAGSPNLPTWEIGVIAGGSALVVAVTAGVIIILYKRHSQQVRKEVQTKLKERNSAIY